MACRSCSRRQLFPLLSSSEASVVRNAAPSTASPAALTRPGTAITSAGSGQRRALRVTPVPAAPSMLETIKKGIARSTVKDTYQIMAASEVVYKTCAAAALYTISGKDKKAGTIPKTEEGEDIGEGTTMWHRDFKLPPTFSTWSQVTMLHMYLIFARARDLEPDTAKSWQKQLVDHYFYDAEEKMDVNHGITSRGLRQRYLKDIFVQWRGVIAAYDEGMYKGDPVLAAAVWRNVFKAREDVDVRMLAAVVSWMRLTLKMLDQMPDEIFSTGPQTAFKWPAKNELLLVDKPVKELANGLGTGAPMPPVEAAAA